MSHNTLTHLDVAFFAATVAEEARDSLERPSASTTSVLKAIFEDDALPEDLELAIANGNYDGLKWEVDTEQGITSLVIPDLGCYCNTPETPDLFLWKPEN